MQPTPENRARAVTLKSVYFVNEFQSALLYEEAIKNYNEEVVINIISSTLHDNAGSINNNCTLDFSPIDKIIELYDEKVALLERLLESEKDKVEILKNSK